MVYRVTIMAGDRRTRYYFKRPRDVYDCIYRHNGGNHEQAAEMADWAELAPSGDNWTDGDIDVSVDPDA